jgi:hypothetical protein
VLFGIIGLVVDPVEEGGIGITGRGAYNDLLRAAFEVPCGPLAAGEGTGRLDDYVGPYLTPGDLGRVALL